MSPFRFAAFVIAASLLASNTSTQAKPKRTSSDVIETSGDLREVKMPVLRSDYFEKKWGKPDVTTFSDGSYRMRFREGKTLNYFFIFGVTHPKPTPAVPPDWFEEDLGRPTPPHKQEWQTAKILRKTVKWYQADGGTGADFPNFNTVAFSLTAPDGRTGSYRIVASCISKKNAADWIQRVNW